MGKEIEILKPYRKRIDDLDKKIVDLLVERVGIIREVAHVKFAHDIPAALPYRIDEVRENAAQDAHSKGIDAELVRSLYATMIEYSCKLEDEMMDDMRQAEKTKMKAK